MVEDWRRSFQAVGDVLKGLVPDSSTDESEGATSSGKEQEEKEAITDSSETTKFVELLEEEEYERIRIGDIPAGQYAKLREERGIVTLVIDTENLPQDVLYDAATEFESIHELLNGFAVGDRGGIAEAAKTQGSGGMVDEIYSRYKGKFPRRLLPVLKDALVLRVTARKQYVSSGEMYDWRGEIAGDHKDRGNDPKEALNLISLCSAGYFDTDRFFHRMYRIQVEHNGWDISKYKEVAGTYIQNNPIVVFVSADGISDIEIYDVTCRKAERIQEYPAAPAHIDICGRGSDTRGVITDSLEIFLENDTVPDYSWVSTDSPDQHILRIEAAPFQS